MFVALVVCGFVLAGAKWCLEPYAYRLLWYVVFSTFVIAGLVL